MDRAGTSRPAGLRLPSGMISRTDRKDRVSSFPQIAVDNKCALSPHVHLQKMGMKKPGTVLLQPPACMN